MVRYKTFGTDSFFTRDTKSCNYFRELIFIHNSDSIMYTVEKNSLNPSSRPTQIVHLFLEMYLKSKISNLLTILRFSTPI